VKTPFFVLSKQYGCIHLYSLGINNVTCLPLIRCFKRQWYVIVNPKKRKMENLNKINLEKEISVGSLFGNQIVPEGMILSGMKDYEKEMIQVFESRQRQQEEADIYNKLLREALLSGSGDKGKYAEAARAMKELYASHHKNTLKPLPIRKEKQRIFTGSIGATVVPPYNYQWQWDASSGTLFKLDLYAQSADGAMFYDAICDYENSSSCSVGAGVGIYFRPMTSNGILQVFSNPSVGFVWGDYCYCDSANTNGFIGIYIGSYNLDGGFAGTLVDQQISLWNDSSWWRGANNTGSNLGFPLFSQCSVDSDHFYAIWVRCGGYNSAAGWSFFGGSGSNSSMFVGVPSITWELF